MSRGFQVMTWPYAMLLIALFADATEAQEAPQPVAYSSYYQCDPLKLARVDSLMRTFWGPIADKHVAAKHATAWGWLGHHTGNAWNRVFYFVAPDVNNAVTAVDGLLADGRAANREFTRETSGACPVHEDYIWQRVAGSQPAAQIGTNRPAAAYAIYYECVPAREVRADAIVTSAFTPMLNRLVQSGDLNSWVWHQHLVGGKYRRLLILDGRDAKSVFAAQFKIGDELRAQQADAFREFSEICTSHQDVVWNVMITK